MQSRALVLERNSLTGEIGELLMAFFQKLVFFWNRWTVSVSLFRASIFSGDRP